MRCGECNRDFTDRGFNRHRCLPASQHATARISSTTPVLTSLDPTVHAPVMLDRTETAAEDTTEPIPAAPDPTDPVPAAPDPILFLWGDIPGTQFTKELVATYERIVFFRQNLFKLPSGSSGKEFIREITRLVRSWNSNSVLMDIAWKCIMVMPALLLQKPSSKSKSKDHSEALKRRLVLWKKGDLNELMRETETIQLRLKSSTPSNNIEAVSKKFAALMKKGKLNAAVKLLTSSMEGGILPLDEETMTLLQTKHPESSDLSEDAVVDVEPVEIHPVVFDVITADSIKTAAMKTRGGAGPSGMDADGWRHILVSRNVGDASDELRTELAMYVRKLCTEKLALVTVGIHKTSSIEAFLANRLVPLDKCPGIRPIGIGEVLRRIAGKVFMSVVKGDVQDSVGSLQVCAGQAGGCEAAVHAMRTLYEEEDTDAVLLIDAANAFNSINRKAMLKNIERICPISYIYAYNCYAPHARLFVVGGKEIRSMEGTSQGDPPSMAFYAIGLLPLIWCLSTVLSPPTAVVPEDPAVQVSPVPPAVLSAPQPAPVLPPVLSASQTALLPPRVPSASHPSTEPLHVPSTSQSAPTPPPVLSASQSALVLPPVQSTCQLLPAPPPVLSASQPSPAPPPVPSESQPGPMLPPVLSASQPALVPPPVPFASQPSPAPPPVPFASQSAPSLPPVLSVSQPALVLPPVPYTCQPSPAPPPVLSASQPTLAPSPVLSASQQVAYADDLTGAGKLHMLRKWLDAIIKNGPKFGYNAEPSKSWLIVKEDRLAEAEQIFEGAGVQITTAGKKHLGAAIGTIDYRDEFMTSLVNKWVAQIETLSKIASFEPHLRMRLLHHV